MGPLCSPSRCMYYRSIPAGEVVGVCKMEDDLVAVGSAVVEAILLCRDVELDRKLTVMDGVWRVQRLQGVKVVGPLDASGTLMAVPFVLPGALLVFGGSDESPLPVTLPVTLSVCDNDVTMGSAVVEAILLCRDVELDRKLTVMDGVWRVQRLQGVKVVGPLDASGTLMAVPFVLPGALLVFGGSDESPLPVTLPVTLSVCDNDVDNLVNALFICAVAIDDVVRTPVVTEALLVFFDSSIVAVLMLGTMLVLNEFDTLPYGDVDGVITAVADDTVETSVVFVGVTAAIITVVLEVTFAVSI